MFPLETPLSCEDLYSYQDTGVRGAATGAIVSKLSSAAPRRRCHESGRSGGSVSNRSFGSRGRVDRLCLWRTRTRNIYSSGK
jgi:hypothetical protein